jgi:hypothetical protein
MQMYLILKNVLMLKLKKNKLLLVKCLYICKKNQQNAHFFH